MKDRPMNNSLRTYLQSRLDQVLADAMKQRSKRQAEVTTEHDPYPVSGWILFEREAMFKAVLLERAKLGKGPISMDLLYRHERMALGHSDYQRKYALYATELVLDESPLQRV